MLRSLHQNDPDHLKKVHHVIYMMNAQDRELYKSYKTERELVVHDADTAEACFEMLKERNGDISSIVIPFSLPDMEGLDFLRELKRKLEYNYIPTIVITNDINERNLVESVNAGAFYYLERPFGEEVFSSVLNKAIKDYTTYVFYLSKAQNVHISRLVTKGQFRFRTFKEAYEVADWLASLCLGRSRDDIVVGFIELLVNAIEHGNLEIDYDEKSQRMKAGNYLEGLIEKLEEPPFDERYVEVDFWHEGDDFFVRITDEGHGFDFEKYMVLDKKRMFHSHGKGILMANNLYFDELSYAEPGNSVTIKIRMK